MTLAVSDARQRLLGRGYVVLPSVVAPETALEWAETAAECFPTRVDRTETDPADLDEGGARHYGVADADAVRSRLPELYGFYEAGTTLMSWLFDRAVIRSPHARSAVTVKIYDRPGDCHGWHLDTNPVTAMLILTATPGDWGTEIDDGTRTFHLRNEPGDMLVMFGRQIRHRVPELPDGERRITVPLNYYHPADTWRPTATDRLVYGG